jgi:hypothetical protein
VGSPFIPVSRVQKLADTNRAIPASTGEVLLSHLLEWVNMSYGKSCLWYDADRVFEVNRSGEPHATARKSHTPTKSHRSANSK